MVSSTTSTVAMVTSRITRTNTLHPLHSSHHSIGWATRLPINANADIYCSDEQSEPSSCPLCGRPRYGTLYDLEVAPHDREGLEAMKARGGTTLAERYRLIDRETTTGERILVYIGEPRES
jgi:hypothetical protein